MATKHFCQYLKERNKAKVREKVVPTMVRMVHKGFLTYGYNRTEILTPDGKEYVLHNGPAKRIVERECEKKKIESQWDDEKAKWSKVLLPKQLVGYFMRKDIRPKIDVRTVVEHLPAERGFSYAIVKETTKSIFSSSPVVTREIHISLSPYRTFGYDSYLGESYSNVVATVTATIGRGRVEYVYKGGGDHEESSWGKRIVDARFDPKEKCVIVRTDKGEYFLDRKGTKKS